MSPEHTPTPPPSGAFERLNALKLPGLLAELRVATSYDTASIIYAIMGNRELTTGGSLELSLAKIEALAVRNRLVREEDARVVARVGLETAVRTIMHNAHKNIDFDIVTDHFHVVHEDMADEEDKRIELFKQAE